MPEATLPVITPAPIFNEQLAIKDFLDFSSEENFIHSCSVIHELWINKNNNQNAQIALNFEVTIENIQIAAYKILAKEKFNTVIETLERIVDFTHLDSQGNSFLHYALLESNKGLAVTILQKFPWLLFSANNVQVTPWEILKESSSMVNEENALQNLTEENFKKINLPQEQVNKIAFALGRLGKTKLLYQLIKAYPQMDFQRLVQNNENLFTTAIKAKQITVVIMLIAIKFKLNATINIDEFDCAVAEKNADIVKILAFFGVTIDRNLSIEACQLLNESPPLLNEKPAHDYLLLSLSTDSNDKPNETNSSEIKISVDSINSFLELQAIYQKLSESNSNTNNNNNKSFVDNFRNYLTYLNDLLSREANLTLLWQDQREMIIRRLNTIYYSGNYAPEQKQKVIRLCRAFQDIKLADHVIHHYLQRGVTLSEVQIISNLTGFDSIDVAKINQGNDFTRLYYFPRILRSSGMIDYADRVQERFLTTPAELLEKLTAAIDKAQQAKVNQQKRVFQQNILMIIPVSLGLIGIIAGISLLVKGSDYNLDHEISCENKNVTKEVHPENNDPICHDEAYDNDEYLSLVFSGVSSIVFGVVAFVPFAVWIAYPNLVLRFVNFVIYLIVTPLESLLNESLDEVTEVLNEVDETIKNISSYAELQTVLNDNPAPATMSCVDALLEKCDAFRHELIASSYIPLFDSPKNASLSRVEVLEEVTHYPDNENPINSMDEEEDEIPLLTLKQRQMPGLLK